MKFSQLHSVPLLKEQFHGKILTIERLTILWSIFRVIAVILTGLHLVTLPIHA